MQATCDECRKQAEQLYRVASLMGGRADRDARLLVCSECYKEYETSSDGWTESMRNAPDPTCDACFRATRFGAYPQCEKHPYRERSR